MIIGRTKEKEMLEKTYLSSESEFIIVYGRRRIGKTFLVREFYGEKKCKLLHVTGLQKGTQQQQLRKYTEALEHTFFDDVTLATPKNWSEALGLLHKQLSKNSEKTVVFLDELPWLATKRSNLLQEIDYYWNHHWSRMNNIILIVCGSSASWLIQKIIYNKGGLHNRATCTIKLLPFNLAETSEYLNSRKIKLNARHKLSLYMALGGIPYYLRYIEPGISAEQNIQKLLFDHNTPLENEFNKLFDSLFENSGAYIELIRLIAKRKEGVGRSELQSKAQLSTSGGRLSRRLKDLCETGFIEEYIPWGRSIGEYYKLIDEFCLFYLHWVDANKNKKFTQDYWLNQSQQPTYHAWSGYAFEAVCMKHMNQIIHALNIKANSTGAWRYIPRIHSENGAQIDLIIDRADNAITIGEIKFTNQPFTIDKPYAAKLKHNIDLFQKKTHTTKQIFLAIISATGLKPTIYSEDMVSGVVVLDDLFKN
jgi:AAA+ ATPase superfamily predicted ATPase